MTTPAISMLQGTRQLNDIQDDRLVEASLPCGHVSPATIDGLEDLSDLVTSSRISGEVEISDVVMCAKCVGECKVF